MTAEHHAALIEQSHYEVTPSTGVVHKVPCVRKPDTSIPWPEFYDYDDRACRYCLPDGLPEVERPTSDTRLWLLAMQRNP